MAESRQERAPLTWTKLDDNFPDEPVIAELSDAAWRLNVEGLIYCNRLLTDGRVGRSQLGKVSSIEAVDLAVTELEQQGVWTAIDGDDAWQLDWTHQRPRSAVIEDREGNKARQQKTRDRRKACAHGDHSLCDPRFCRAKAAEIAVPRDVPKSVPRDVPGVVPPASPDPSRPGPKEPGKGRPKCEHRKPIADDGERCDECVEAATTAAKAQAQAAVSTPTTTAAEVAS